MIKDKIINVMISKFSDKGLSQSEINESLNLDRTTLYRQLQDMQKTGEIFTSGSGRYTAYHLNKDSRAFIKWELSGIPALRDRVFYDHSFLENYEPNITNLLSESQLIELHEASSIKTDISPEQYRRVLNFLIIDLSHSSSVLEGVNIAWVDTKTIIDTNVAPPGLSEFDKNVVLNHKAAIKFIIENDVAYNRRDILDVHSLLMKGLFNEDGKDGSIRSNAVELGISRYSPLSIQNQISLEFDKFLKKADAIKDPFEKCFFSMVFIPYLQPFSDGNRRTSRLISNLPLINNKLAPFSYSGLIKSEYDFGLLSFYERRRHELLSDVFVGSYKKTSGYYNELIQKIESGTEFKNIDGDDDVVSEILVNRPKPK